MFLDYPIFCARVEAVCERIAAACRRCARDSASVQLLPVTKNHPAIAAEYVARSGLPAVGENRVQEAVGKKNEVSASLRWELIGHLQTNKARLAATHFDRVQSVDSEKLLGLLDRAAGELGRRLPILLQVNSGYDPAKFGADPADIDRLLDSGLGKAHLRIDGLMAIAPLGQAPTETADLAKRTFENLRTIRDRLATHSGAPLTELSMGMTADLEIAVAAGSTLVRVGTALFGERA